MWNAVFFLLKESPFRLAGLIALMIFTALLDTIGIGSVIPLVTVVINPGLMNMYAIFAPIHALINMVPFPPIITVSVAILILFICKTIFSLATIYMSARVIYSLRTRLTKRLFSLYLDMPYVLYVQKNSIDMMYKCTQEVGLFAQNIIQPITIFFTEFTVLIGIVGLLLWFDPKVTSIALGFMLIGGWFFIGLTRKALKIHGTLQLQAQNIQQKEMDQVFLMFKTIRVMAKQMFFISRTMQWLDQYERSGKKTFFLHSTPKVFYELLFAFGLSGFCLTAFIMHWTGQRAVLSMALFAAAIFRLLPAFNRITFSYSTIRTHSHTVPSLFFEIRELEADSALPKHRPLSYGKFEKDIALKNISFAYPGSVKPVIDDVSLTIRKGQKVGIIGKSGAGKTTLVDIILGILPQSSGDIVVDGEHKKLMFGYVPQRITLLDDSVRRNVAFGLSDADIQDAQVWQALKKAKLDDIVRELPQGLDTSLGENGIRLSGGQAQRIGIARALYNDPDVLVFDEATSSLDHETEKHISDNIMELGQDKTLIIIAHRLTTIEKCDYLFVLDKGKIAAEGNGETLSSYMAQ